MHNNIHTHCMITVLTHVQWVSLMVCEFRESLDCFFIRYMGEGTVVSLIPLDPILLQYSIVLFRVHQALFIVCVLCTHKY